MDQLRVRHVVEKLGVHGYCVVLIVDEELVHVDRHVGHLKLQLYLLSRHVDRLQLEEGRHGDEEGDDQAEYCGVQAAVGLSLNLTSQYLVLKCCV